MTQKLAPCVKMAENLQSVSIFLHPLAQAACINIQDLFGYSAEERFPTASKLCQSNVQKEVKYFVDCDFFFLH